MLKMVGEQIEGGNYELTGNYNKEVWQTNFTVYQ